MRAHPKNHDRGNADDEGESDPNRLAERDAENESVRFERGDTIDTGSLAPTGSGSKYEGSFGRFIWIKGEAATYREPDPDGSRFECVLARQE